MQTVFNAAKKTKFYIILAMLTPSIATTKNSATVRFSGHQLIYEPPSSGIYPAQ